MENEIARDREEVHDLQRNMSVFGKRQMIRWAVRWVIGFSLIGLVVYFQPRWSWLWWVGMGFATLTPIVTLTSQWLVGRQVRRVEKALAELEDAAHEAEED